MKDGRLKIITVTPETIAIIYDDNTDEDVINGWQERAVGDDF